MHAREIHIDGIVQGVGFRPHVARLARALECTGWVLNSSHGVDIFIQHDNENVLDEFERTLIDEAPRASRILRITSSTCETGDIEDFQIKASEHDDIRSTLISPDLATCDECLDELFDENDRRYHYPFINCTNCGPRFTIIEDLPYDRPVTSMREFEMCPECTKEYGNDQDRRYHAQPDACFTCGPSLWWNAPDALCDPERSDSLIAQAAKQLEAGDVLAIKGLGGWHLACDATNEDAVAKLRERKQRPSKPLAIMTRDIEQARELATIGDVEAELVERPARPIVLLESKNDSSVVANVTCGVSEIGIMLPSTPVQHLLLRTVDVPLVMTSGNRSGEPIVADDEEALEALGTIADGFLGNNRRIVARYDDSVMRIRPDGKPQMIRRARGFAPAPLLIEENSGPTIFAAGPEQKSTFATLQDDRVYISQHLGDLERLGSWKAWEEAKTRYERLFDTHPGLIACDMHPEYLATKWAHQESTEHNLPLIEVQHHHAHIASVLGENNIQDPVIGIALDGTGYGTDGSIWGGEILIATRNDFERFWHLPQFRLPGGSAAIMNPERTAYALLVAYTNSDDEFFGQFSLDNPQFAPFLEKLENRELLDQMIEKGINSPLTSSAGRLFDAVSALLGICIKPSYDGEAASLLEAAAHEEMDSSRALALDQNEQEAPLTAASFHEGLINAIIRQTVQAREETGINDVALSGGCMVNRILSEGLSQRLRDLGFTVYENRDLPPNDGCIAYGQTIVARARSKE